MNGINGHPAMPALWQEARNTDGRIYYFNTITKATQWTKPEELMTPAERALANQPWKEYTAEGGRKYWYNTETKQSSWEMPDVYKEALEKEKVKQEAPNLPAAPTFVAGAGGSNPYDHPRERERDPLPEARQIAYGNDVNGSRPQAFVPANTDPDYSTYEEAEAAFLKLLRRSGVQPDWTWEQAMRSIIKDPQYRALKDPKDRKAAFEKYAVEVRLQEKDRAKERLAKLRTDFGTMLKSHPEIKHYTRWKTAKPIIEGETIYRNAKDDDEARQLFEDYIIELKKTNMEGEAVTRKAAMDELVSIMGTLNLEPYTRWSEAQGIIHSHARFSSDDKFKILTKSDVLTVFENHIKSLERTFNDVRQRERNQKARKERQNRDRFITLLADLRKSCKIKAGTKWSSIYPLIESDDRYLSMLGQPGSSPLDLFWDIVEEEERALRSTRNDVLDVLDDKRFEIQPRTTFDEFLALMQNDRRTANIDRDSLSLIFERLREKVTRRNEDDRHQSERHQHRAIDKLRSVIKHLEPPVRHDDTWEKVRPRIERTEEFLAVTSEEARQSAFDKTIRRLKDRISDEEERDRMKRRDRASVDRPRDRDRERERDRDRGERPHRSSGGRHRSRSPEPDIYEADRRKAIADREKNYRKTSVADTLLSPGRRGIDRSDRDRDIDRPYRSRREPSPRYDRDRRDSRDDRDRGYRRRADPRSEMPELQYGDERPSSGARRRRPESDNESVGSRRDSKRVRRERTPRERSPNVPRDRRHKTRTPPPPEPAKEEPAVHSGSEEGEIEEE